MNKVAFLVVFFGKAPNFIHLFLHSCKKQKNIDFLFFTDWDWKNIDIPTNVITYNTNLSEFCKQATNKLGIEIKIEKGYKLCDLKPAWTHIYEDYLSAYSHVGYCDIDLFWGDIRHFFNEEIESNADLFTITQKYLSGALTIYKNNTKMRTLYREAKGWDYIFCDSRHFAFDEFLRIHPSDCDIESFSDLIFRKEEKGEISVEHNRYIGYEKRPYHIVCYSNGEVWAEDKEWIFFHYVVAKQYALWVIPDWKNIPEVFYVNKYGFYKEGALPIKLIDLFYKKFYVKQLVKALKNKFKTLKILILNMKFHDLLNAIKKQIESK